MHIGVYGSGYLATVISACLADFGTPVCCCHADSSHIVEVAKGNIPFYEKNLQEVIRRNVRSGRLVYSTDPEDLAKRAQVIFLIFLSCRVRAGWRSIDDTWRACRASVRWRA